MLAGLVSASLCCAQDAKQASIADDQSLAFIDSATTAFTPVPWTEPETGVGCCDGLPTDGCCGCQSCEVAASRIAEDRFELTGDWWGRRSALEDGGIDIRSSLTQFYQGVSSGGTNRRFRYGGKYDLYFDLDSEKMGLWEGGELLIHLADWQFGQNSNADATFGSPVNFNQVLPEPEESFAVSHFLYRQMLTENGWLMEIGRYSLLDLWDGFYPGYGNGLDGFMNASLICPFNVGLSGIPPISNLVGLVKAGEKGLEGGVVMFENEDNSNKIGLEFPNGVTFLLFARKYTEFGGLLGTHTLASTLSTSDFTDLNYNDWIQVPDGLPTPTSQSGQWTAGYIGEQRIRQDPCNANRFTNFRYSVYWADSGVNPYDFSSFFLLEKFGTKSRPNDRMGIGYFYNNLGQDFRDLLNVLEPHRSMVQGGEIYYNAQITPWSQLTFNLQAVSPINASRDTAVVPGLRYRVNF
jgi:porin